MSSSDPKADGFGFWPAVSEFFVCLLLSQVSVRSLLKAHCWPLATSYCILFPVKALSLVIPVGKVPKKLPGAAGCGRGD